MADATLAAAFGALEIEKRDLHPAAIHSASHHVLELAYPDFTIPIQENEAVEMTPPAKMEHRARPPINPHELAVYDTNFNIALPLESLGNARRPYNTAHMQLFAAVEALKSGAGKTKLGVLRLCQEIWDERIFRVRLETHYVGPMPPTPPREYELTVAEWKSLMQYADRRPWIGVLNHLVERASAKALYHVRQRLIATVGSDEADREEESWGAAWGVKPAFQPRELFLEHFAEVPKNIAAGKMPQLVLDCGHVSSLTCDKVLKLKEWEMFQLVCDVCKVPVMTPGDKQYLKDVEAQNEAFRFAKMQKVWANLVQNVHDPNKPRMFHATSIFRIVAAALDSLRSPDWVSPAALCPSTFRETREVLEHLESILWGNDLFWDRTAEELLEELEHEALGVQIDDVPLSERVNPPGWDDFVARWFRRTAYFLAYRRCRRGDQGCEGLHGHRDGLWYSPEQWEKIQGELHERRDPGFDTAELMRALESIEA